MKGMLAPKFKEVLLGHAQVRQTFKVSGVGTIAGSYVTDGKIARNAQIRLLRDNVVIHEGKIDSLKRFKDDAKEVNTGYECGIGIENYNDIKENDVIECFVMEEVQKLSRLTLRHGRSSNAPVRLSKSSEESARGPQPFRSKNRARRRVRRATGAEFLRREIPFPEQKSLPCSFRARKSEGF